jgi:hypothetical protein
LQFGHIKWQLCPIGVTDFQANTFDVILDVLRNSLKEFCFVLRLDGFDVFLSLLLLDQKLLALILRVVTEQDNSFKLSFVL